MIDIKNGEPMEKHTTFRIGGPAKYFVIAKDAVETEEAVSWAKVKGVRFEIIGSGSNVLVSDEGFDGLIIKQLGFHIAFDGARARCFAGLPLAKAINDSLDRGLVGLEWAAGIPGTVGGAIHNNAGAYGGEMAQSVESVTILREGEILELPAEDCSFSYRSSRFKIEENNDWIISAVLKLSEGSSEDVAAARERMAKILSERRSKFHGNSAGSTFKNIIMSEDEISEFKSKHPVLPEQFVGYRKIPAAWLIDECGLRGRQIGGAKVSDDHAGIIINAGGATAKDIIMLISVIKQKVRSKFSLQLMEEIEYLGF